MFKHTKCRNCVCNWQNCLIDAVVMFDLWLGFFIDVSTGGIGRCCGGSGGGGALLMLFERVWLLNKCFFVLITCHTNRIMIYCSILWWWWRERIACSNRLNYYHNRCKIVRQFSIGMDTHTHTHRHCCRRALNSSINPKIVNDLIVREHFANTAKHFNSHDPLETPYANKLAHYTHKHIHHQIVHSQLDEIGELFVHL